MATEIAAGTSTGTVPAVRINGRAHGGAYPIQNATVILTETQNNGVWTAANSAYVGTGKPLYVTTSDANGNFTFPDSGWSCDAGQYVYIEVTGGKTTTATNANVVQLGLVGDCAADLGSTAQIDALNVFISEPSTVAAAYALRSFIAIHSGTLKGTASDGTANLTATIPLVDITAPTNNNVVPVNPALNPASTANGSVQVSLASAYNAYGIYTDGTSFTTGGFDNDGNAYSYQQVGTSVTYGGVTYALGPANQKDVVQGNGGPTITLPSGNFDALNFLGAGINGKQASQTFTLTYQDGSTTKFTQSMSDWYTPTAQNYTGESIALTTSYRNQQNGTKDNRQFSMYQYSFAVDRTKLLKSLTLPSNANVEVIAMTATNNLPACNGVRAGTALSCTAAGVAHGFQNAYNLVDQVTFGASQFPSGASRATLPGNTQAVAPREMVNTLGNILQECVDSAGGTVSSYANYQVGTSRCGDLFYYTTPPGSTTSPTNTLQAALNMALYPSNNVSQLMGLKPRNVFFSPEISQIDTTQNFGFTVSIFYKGTNLGDTIASPADLALDVQDNVYVSYGGGQQTATMDELTANGKGVWTSSLSGVSAPKAVALDTNGFVWVTDDTATSGGVTGLYTSVNATQNNKQGTAYNTVSVAKGSAAGIGFDASSNMFVTRDSNDANATAFLYTAASTYGTSTSYALNYPYQNVRADALGNFYAVGTSGSNSQWLTYEYATCGTGTAPVASNIGTASGISMAINNNVGTSSDNNAIVPASGRVVSRNSSTNNCNSITTSAPATRATGLSSSAPAGSAMDSGLTFFWVDGSAGVIDSMAGAGSATDLSSITVSTIAPCYVSGSACSATSSAAFKGMAIDSSGAMWFLSGGGSYGLVQTLGLAAPEWPLLASENSGVVVQ